MMILMMIMNVEYIWLTLLNKMQDILYCFLQIKVPPPSANDLNQLIYSRFAPPRRFWPLPRPTPKILTLAPPRPAGKKPAPPIPETKQKHSSDLLPISGLEPKFLLRCVDGVVEDRVNPFTIPFAIPPPQILTNKISTAVKIEIIFLSQPPPPAPLPQ